MDLAEFLIKELPFDSEYAYIQYESPTHFNATLYPLTEIPRDSINDKIREFYKNFKCEQVEDELLFKKNIPPIKIMIEECDFGEDYFFNLRVREL